MAASGIKTIKQATRCDGVSNKTMVEATKDYAMQSISQCGARDSGDLAWALSAVQLVETCPTLVDGTGALLPCALGRRSSRATISAGLWSDNIARWVAKQFHDSLLPVSIFQDDDCPRFSLVAEPDLQVVSLNGGVAWGSVCPPRLNLLAVFAPCD